MRGEEEVVVFGGVPIDDLDGFGDLFAFVVFEGNFDTVFQEQVDFAIGLHRGHQATVAGEFFDGKVVGFGGQGGIEVLQHREELRPEDDLRGGFTPQRSGRAEGFFVTVARCPTQSIQQGNGWLFYKIIFGIIRGHFMIQSRQQSEQIGAMLAQPGFDIPEQSLCFGNTGIGCRLIHIAAHVIGRIPLAPQRI